MHNIHTDNNNLVTLRPWLVTVPILSRIMEKTVVRHFVYPALSTLPSSLSFRDQFAYLPTGSTTAALIQILHTVTHLLASHDSVSVIALDFTKAFDTVRHATLLHKMANIGIPDAVYNWLVSYFCNHSHCTKYRGQVSPDRTQSTYNLRSRKHDCSLTVKHSVTANEFITRMLYNDMYWLITSTFIRPYLLFWPVRSVNSLFYRNKWMNEWAPAPA